MCWHWDHSKNRNVKGVTLLTLLTLLTGFVSYDVDESNARVSLPISYSYEVVEKTISYYDVEFKKERRCSKIAEFHE